MSRLQRIPLDLIGGQTVTLPGPAKFLSILREGPVFAVWALVQEGDRITYTIKAYLDDAEIPDPAGACIGRVWVSRDDGFAHLFAKRDWD